MMNRKEFTKIAKRILNSHKKMQRPALMHPAREWMIGILIAILIFGGSALWSAQTYKTYQNTSVSFDVEAEEKILYREALVQAALTKFAERQQIHEELIQNQSNAPILPEEEVVITEPESVDTATSTEEVAVGEDAPTNPEETDAQPSLQESTPDEPPVSSF